MTLLVNDDRGLATLRRQPFHASVRAGKIGIVGAHGILAHADSRGARIWAVGFEYWRHAAVEPRLIGRRQIVEIARGKTPSQQGGSEEQRHGSHHRLIVAGATGTAHSQPAPTRHVALQEMQESPHGHPVRHITQQVLSPPHPAAPHISATAIKALNMAGVSIETPGSRKRNARSGVEAVS